jgi:hypothetical protein
VVIWYILILGFVTRNGLTLQPVTLGDKKKIHVLSDAEARYNLQRNTRGL